jgi:hypothetical protein
MFFDLVNLLTYYLILSCQNIYLKPIRIFQYKYRKIIKKKSLIYMHLFLNKWTKRLSSSNFSQPSE